MPVTPTPSAFLQALATSPGAAWAFTASVYAYGVSTGLWLALWLVRRADRWHGEGVSATQVGTPAPTPPRDDP